MAPRPAPFSHNPSEEEYQRHYDYFTNDSYKTFAKLMVRAWMDPDFDRELRANPADVMRAAGIPLPEGYHIAPEQFVMVDRPENISIDALSSDAELAAISCAGSASSLSCPSCTASCAGSGGC